MKKNKMKRKNYSMLFPFTLICISLTGSIILLLCIALEKDWFEEIPDLTNTMIHIHRIR